MSDERLVTLAELEQEERIVASVEKPFLFPRIVASRWCATVRALHEALATVKSRMEQSVREGRCLCDEMLDDEARALVAETEKE